MRDCREFSDAREARGKFDTAETESGGLGGELEGRDEEEEEEEEEEEFKVFSGSEWVLSDEVVT